MFLRKVLARAAAAALLFTLAQGVALAQTTLRVAYIPILDATPLFVGVEKGFFKELGLDVVPTPIAGGAAGIAGLMSGAYDVLYSNIVSTILAKHQGFKVVIVGAGTKQYPGPNTDGIIVRKGDGIKTGKDLEDKTVAVNTRNGVIWLFARAWIAKTGGDPSKIKYREIPFPQMNDALRGKQVDAAFQVNPFYDSAVGKGEFEAIGEPYGEVQPGVEIGQYVATEEFYNKNRDAVVKFARGLAKSVAWYNSNQTNPETLRIISSVTKMQPEVIAKMELGRLPEKIDPAMLAATAALMKESGLLTTDVDIRALVVPDAIQ